MRNKRRKLFVLCVALCLLVTALIPSALAFKGNVEKTLIYRDIKISLDGIEFIPKDVNGTVVEPFIINGTTYLPVRAVAEAFGLKVDWDDPNSTVVLTSPEVAKIYITRTGSKYHHDSHCNGGTYWEVPYESAIGMGLKPCSKCVQ